MVRLENVLKISLQDVLKMSWRRLEDIWPRRIYWSWLRGLQDVLKTSSEEVRLRRTYSSCSRRLEDVLKTSSEEEDERRLHQDEYLLRYSSFGNKRKQSHRDVLQKRCSKKFRKIHKKTPVPARFGFVLFFWILKKHVFYRIPLVAAAEQRFVKLPQTFSYRSFLFKWS